jgi:hypothetical protein
MEGLMPFDGSMSDLEVNDKFTFEVDAVPIYTQQVSEPDHFGYVKREYLKAPEKHQAIVRQDTGDVLGIHGGRYKIRPYAEMFDRVNEMIAAADVGTRAVVNDDLFDNGGKMRRQIQFPDLKIQPQIDDIVNFRVDMFNSYDGSWAEQYVAWAMRLWCLNGCTSSAYSVRSVIKHTSTDWKADVHVERFKRSIEMFFNSETEYKRWVSRDLKVEQVETLFRRTLAHRPEPGDASKISKPVLVELLDLYSMEPPTVWGAYNAATNWASHIKKTRGGVHNVERRRHNEVAKMMRSDQWLEIAA